MTRPRRFSVSDILKTLGFTKPPVLLTLREWLEVRCEMKLAYPTPRLSSAGCLRYGQMQRRKKAVRKGPRTFRRHDHRKGAYDHVANPVVC